MTDPADEGSGPGEVIVLGSGSAFSIERDCASLAVRTAGGRILLLDTGLGNGALRGLRRAGVPLESVSAIFISHQHNDHAAGFLTLMLHMRGLQHSFEVFCRPGVAAALRTVTDLLLPGVLQQVGERLRWRECEPFQEAITLQGEARLRFLPVEHLIDALGVQVWIDGVALAYTGDTRPSAALAEAARGSRLLIHEATELANEDGLAVARPATGHSTAAEAGQAATLAGCQRLLLTHIGDASAERERLLLEEARQAFPNGTVVVARDGLRLRL